MAFGVLLGALAGSWTAPTWPAPPSIRVDAAWIRWLPADVPAAGYLTLINDSDHPIVLVAAESVDFQDVTIHRSVEHAGLVGMEPVREISVDPHSRLEFGAKGYHLMLMHPVRSIATQTQISVTLRFRDGTSLPVPFQVRKAGAGS